MSDRQIESEPLFRTIVRCPANAHQIELSHTIICIGSCFAETMAERLTTYRFSVFSNPTGTLYNPLSMAAALDRVVSGTRFDLDDIFEHNQEWIGFQHHSRFGAQTAEACLDKMNAAFDTAVAALGRLDTLILTFGSAFVFREKTTGMVVANCHRLPHERFTRELAPVDEIVAAWRSLLLTIFKRRPDLNVVISVSPVRHLRDDPHENQVSKAHLLVAIDALQRAFPQIYYFPAFEIMMDDLRDYRFYAEDMVHPSAVAIEQIWQRFSRACISNAGREFVRRFEPVERALRHRVTAPGTRQTREFAMNMLASIQELSADHPQLDLTDATAHFAAML
jgi:hypothetical protein